MLLHATVGKALHDDTFSSFSKNEQNPGNMCLSMNDLLIISLDNQYCVHIHVQQTLQALMSNYR